MSEPAVQFEQSGEFLPPIEGLEEDEVSLLAIGALTRIAVDSGITKLPTDSDIAIDIDESAFESSEPEDRRGRKPPLPWRKIRQLSGDIPLCSELTDLAESLILPRRTSSATQQSADDTPIKPAGVSKVAPTGDSVSIYFEQISQIRLLKPEEEVFLGQKVQRGISLMDELKETGCAIDDRLSLDEKVILKESQLAKDLFLQANLKWAVRIARWHYHHGVHGLEMADLIQSANIGLQRAVEKFDPSRGIKFATYCYRWCCESIQYYRAETGTTIRIPRDLTSNIDVERFAARRDGRPMNPELAAIDRISRPQSLDKSASMQTDETLADQLSDNYYNIEAEGIKSSFRLKVLSLVDQLDERTSQMILLRYGFIGGTEHLLEEVGAEFGVTRERARQLIAKGLEKLSTLMNDSAVEDWL